MDRIRRGRPDLAYADDQSQAGVSLLGIEFHGFWHVLGPKDLQSVLGIVGIEDTEDDIPLSEHDRMQVSCLNVATRDGCQDGGFSCCGRDAEDSIHCLSTNFKVVVVPVPCHRTCTRVRASKGAFQSGMQLCMRSNSDRLQCRWIDLWQSCIVALQPDVDDL